MGKYRHDHGGALSIDGCAYASALRGWNPGYKAALSAASLVLCIAYSSAAVSAAVILGMACLTVRRGGLPLGRYLSLLSVPLAFLALSGLAVALGISRRPLGDYRVYLGPLCLYATRESLRQALELTLKALGGISALYMLTLSTPAGEIIQVLRSLHVPRTILELMDLIYRYIFLLLDTHCRMRNAAASRLGYRDYRTALSTFGRTASNLLVVSLGRGTAYYQALASRCYDGELRFLREEKPVRPGQILWAVLYLAFLTLLWRIGR